MKLLRPLRERDFALLWTGMTISLLGDGIFLVAEVRERDQRDADREHSPMVAAPDAVEVDTTGLGIDDVVERIVALVGARTP